MPRFHEWLSSVDWPQELTWYDRDDAHQRVASSTSQKTARLVGQTAMRPSLADTSRYVSALLPHQSADCSTRNFVGDFKRAVDDPPQIFMSGMNKSVVCDASHGTTGLVRYSSGL